MKAKLREALTSGVEVLERLELRYAIVGGIAVGAWGVRRATDDVDVYADLPDHVRSRLHAELEAAGFHVPAMEAELTRFGVFRSRSSGGVFLDIFSAVGPLGEAILVRRKQITVDGRLLWFATAEDISVLKAFSDRPRDHADLEKLALVLGERLDRGYVERWARELDASIGGTGVSERVSRAFAIRPTRT